MQKRSALPPVIPNSGIESQEENKSFVPMIVCRLLLTLALSIYFWWLPTDPAIFNKNTIYWMLITFAAFQAAGSWMLSETLQPELSSRLVSLTDVSVMTLLFVADSNPFPFTILVFLSLLITSAVQQGMKSFLELMSASVVIIFLSTIIRHLNLNQPLYLPLYATFMVFAVCAYLIKSMLERNHRLSIMVSQLGETDTLTGMLNQQAFIRSADYLIDLAQRSPMPMVLLIAEIENYHNLKETQGQKTADLILKHFSRITLINLRRNDLAARYTGNIFTFLITHVDKKSAERVATRLQHEFALWADREKFDTSISFVMTTVPDYNITIQLLLKHVGKYLYLSRRKGTPGVTHAPPLTGEEILKYRASSRQR